jgi:hypothetical protein
MVINYIPSPGGGILYGGVLKELLSGSTGIIEVSISGE